MYITISFWELISTINKDYLQAINIINIPFAILSTIALYYSYQTNNWGILILLFLGIYTLVFFYLISKLIYRTYKYSLITNVIYTKEGLVIHGKIFNYKDDLKLTLLLEKLENLFDEYLSKPSNLKEIIKVEREKLLNKLSNNFKTVSQMQSKQNIRISKDSGKIIAFVYGALVIYSISVVIFYFLGLILGFIIFFILISIISFYFFINKSVELKIKQEVTKIDTQLDDLEEIYANANKKVADFYDGEIFNLSKHLEDEYKNFYSKINKIIDLKDKLKNTIENSKYKNFIDFSLFASYLKNQFNKPLHGMIKLLENYKEKVLKELKDATLAFENTDSKEKYKIEVRISNLETINKNITLHLEQLKASIF